MSRLFYHTMQDNAGNLLFDVSGTMRLAGTGTLATIYGDEALTVILANPMTNHPSFGSFKCFLGAGDYDFYLAKSGYTFETLTGVQGHGTMAQQDASAVAITGGVIANITGLNVSGLTTLGSTTNVTGPLNVGTPTTLSGTLGVQNAPQANVAIQVRQHKATQYGLYFLSDETDSGNPVIQFSNNAGTGIGTISTNATTTNYNTTSDARLKHAIQTLTGALDVVRALRPVSFRWNVDDSEGRGFVASEVQQVAPEAVTGEPDAVDAFGSVVPQGLDMSKLVPYLVGAVQMLAEQLDSAGLTIDGLMARVAVLEGAIR